MNASFLSSFISHVRSPHFPLPSLLQTCSITRADVDGNGLGCLELKTSDDVDAAMKLDQSEFKNSLMEDGVTITVARPDDFKSPEPAADGGGGGGGGGDNDVDEDGRDRRRSRSRSRDGDDEEDSSKKAEDADGDKASEAPAEEEEK